MDKNSIHEITIREATQHHIERIISIWESAELHYRPKGRDTRENLLKQLFDSHIKIFIASTHNTDIATVMVTHDGRKGWVNRLAVLKNYRNKGIAHKLTTHSEQWLASQGIQIYAVLIEEPNNPSMNLFTKAGYTRHDDIIYFTRKIHPYV